MPLNPPLAKQDKEILDAWFYSCKAEKCPEIPLQTCKGGEEKVGNPTHNVPLSPSYPNSTRKSLGFGSTVALGTSGYGASAASPPTAGSWPDLFATEGNTDIIGVFKIVQYELIGSVGSW